MTITQGIQELQFALESRSRASSDDEVRGAAIAMATSSLRLPEQTRISALADALQALGILPTPTVRASPAACDPQIGPTPPTPELVGPCPGALFPTWGSALSPSAS